MVFERTAQQSAGATSMAAELSKLGWGLRSGKAVLKIGERLGLVAWFSYGFWMVLGCFRMVEDLGQKDTKRVKRVVLFRCYTSINI